MGPSTVGVRRARGAGWAPAGARARASARSAASARPRLTLGLASQGLEQVGDQLEAVGIDPADPGDLLDQGPQPGLVVATDPRGRALTSSSMAASEAPPDDAARSRRVARTSEARSRSTRLALIATAAWRANTAASSMSRSENAAWLRLSRTSRTPMVPWSSTSGTATIERGR